MLLGDFNYYLSCAPYKNGEFRMRFEETLRIIDGQDKVIREQADLIALLKAQLQAKEEGDLCI